MRASSRRLGCRRHPCRAAQDGGEGLTGNSDGFDYQNLHRNKRAIKLDLKSEDGRKIFYALIAKSDVVVENMRAKVKYRLGVDYET